MYELQRLLEIEEHIKSGRLAEDFEDGSKSRKEEILEFLEKLMELGELADETATKLIFKDSYLEALSGVKVQK
ncbi:hypothetical protein V6C53_02085 [Desulfocurvibacter africanus]|uniref:Uncharacterized protein n=1 Tax=Desulfocurvibacter africanus subsp. africanus str. Walvis Bay TaxID=690850 RepID=F3Z0X9_DESAF|nr:hypothetical protein [Desulfocurvibacter africanus]EGJ51057.1 hypothetical protein Desaf_2742 [Desulfocurvibacter africanus subsp. africanus str. Walvis Bay]